MSKIIVIGSISMDLVMETSRIAQEGETVFGDKFSMVPGGKGANQAVALGRLSADGDQISMLGTVGEDAFGSLLKDNLRANKVETEFVGTVPLSSGIAQITLHNHDNRIIYCPGANSEVHPEKWDSQWELISQADLVILQNEIPHEANKIIAEYCKDKKIKLLYNPAPARDTDHEMIALVDYFTPNEHECQDLFPDQSLEEVLKTYPNKIIVTLGSKGSVYCDGREIKTIAAIKAKVVDTTGAGDTFNGALALALAKEASIDKALKFATLASHLSVQKFGAQGGMPSLKEMKENEHYEENWNFE
ncbi:ribokinase [Streptococcus catagoni]|uniref:ribokinase n=1 Tax=Streptococcus catagoni TaxID=2654874 RepID=UPI00140820A3|nr:ribokinase [Streptococcus catagoni]